METYGWWSILPPVVAIGLAIITKQVYLSLGLFIWLGWTIMSTATPVPEYVHTLDIAILILLATFAMWRRHLLLLSVAASTLVWVLVEGRSPTMGLVRSVDVFLTSVTNSDNAQILLFSALIGAMITFTQASGGMEGFIRWVDRRGLTRSRRSVSFMTVGVSMAVFLESNFGLLVSGSVARPLFDKCRISREKLSYIIDATCAPKCILIGSLLPLNAWGAYVLNRLGDAGVEQPLPLLMSTVPLNFYSVLAIALMLVSISIDWNIGPMRESERRVREEGKLLSDGARPMVATDVTMSEPKPDIPKRAINMVLPIGTMVAMVPVALYLTGAQNLEGSGEAVTVFAAITNGDGSAAVLWGVIIGLLVAAAFYKAQGVMTILETTEQLLKGIQGLVPLVIVLSLAFAIGATTGELGTGQFVAQAVSDTLSVGLVPALVFLLACLIAFSTGTSWGTFGIMIPIVVPMIELLDIHPGLTIAAALGGGIFGDHSSPISDSTIVASMASATDHIDHVRTQLPYALTAAGGATALFLIFGFVL